MNKERPTCGICGSSMLTWNRQEQWSEDEQAFVPRGNCLKDQVAYCEDCYRNTSVVWIRVLHPPLVLEPVHWGDLKEGDRYLYSNSISYKVMVRHSAATKSVEDDVKRWRLPRAED